MLVLPLFELVFFREGAIIVFASFLQEGARTREVTHLFVYVYAFFFLIPRLYARGHMAKLHLNVGFYLM